MQHRTCADPYFFVKGGGVHARLPENSNVILSHQLFYSLQGVQSFINGFISEKAIDLLFTGFRGGPTFSEGGGGGLLFPERVQMLFSIGTM